MVLSTNLFLTDMFIKIDNVLINHNFNDGIEVEVRGPDPFYLVEVREFVGSEDY